MQQEPLQLTARLTPVSSKQSGMFFLKQIGRVWLAVLVGDLSNQEPALSGRD
jgi:hypothetical protein